MISFKILEVHLVILLNCFNISDIEQQNFLMYPGFTLNKVLGEFMNTGNVKIRNISEVEYKISNLIKGGPEALQVITDFDQTITKYYQNGEICDDTYSVLTNSRFLPKKFKIQSKLNYEKYGQIESNNSMSVEERIPYMLEWQDEFIKSLQDCQFNRKMLEEATKESKTYLRDNVKVVFEKLNKVKVPVLIFSAGIEDILMKILEINESIYPNMRIVSNKFQFSDDDSLLGFRQPTIHTFNKHQHSSKHEVGNIEYFNDLSHRKNGILLGDNIGDVHMANGMKSNDDGVILKIGFLEKKVAAQLDSYMAQYDIVILNDESWNLFHTILQYILKTKFY